jgi:quercetin dioxygenase-like cupin family protein
MTIKLVALVLLCLMTGTAVAQEPKVTSLMSKDLPENPGREALMITVEHAPGGSSAIHRHNAHAFVYVLEGSVVMQLKGGQQVTLTPGQSFRCANSSNNAWRGIDTLTSIGLLEGVLDRRRQWQAIDFAESG